MRTLVSVIVPVYNAKHTIEKCVRSILSQTYTNFELILIDDGSTDGSMLICQSLARLDSRILVFRQANQGVSMARNCGMAMSHGEWMAFVDADDYVCPSFLGTLLEQAEDSEVVIGGCNKVTFPDKVENGWKRFPETRLYRGSCDNQHVWDEILIYGTPWGKLFKSALIKNNHIIFPVDFQLHEDHIFFFEILAKVCCVKVIEDSCYNYVDLGTETLSRRSLLPVHLKMDAYKLLSEKLDVIVERHHLERRNLPATDNFIIRLYMAAVVLSYRNRNRNERLLMPSISLRKQIARCHKPISLQGRILKFIVVYLPHLMQKLTLKSVIK